MENKTISIIIPVYNMAKYIQECLDSIISQTLKNIEVICIDDGSKDASLSILNNYKKRYNDLVVISQNNQGAAIARNTGIRVSTGEYVCFMDPDDYYPSNDVLETLYNSAKNNHVMICGGSLNSLKEGKIIDDYFENTNYYVFNKSQKIKYADYQWEYGFTRFCYYRQFLIDNDICFPNYSRYEDPPFFVKAMICAEEFYAVDKVTYVYREGYKKLNLTENKIVDMLSGAGDILDMSRQYNLVDLHNLCIKKMIGFQSVFYEYLLKGNEAITNAINRFDEKIDSSFVNEISTIDVKHPSILYNFHVYKKRIDIENDFKTQIESFNKIAIYGLDFVAHYMKEYINRAYPDKELCFYIWADNKSEEFVDGIPVKTIMELIECRNEVLMEAVILDQSYEALVETLESLKFPHIARLETEDYNWICWRVLP